jgi:hypothetical protein
MEFTLTIDKWEGSLDKGTSHKIQKDDVNWYLRELDGDEHTVIVIVPYNRKSSLMIGGGNDGVYVVIYTVGVDDDFYNLTDPNKKGSKEITVIAGGQAGSQLEKYCVDLQTAVAAATYYVETGERNPSLSWELQI